MNLHFSLCVQSDAVRLFWSLAMVSSLILNVFLKPNLLDDKMLSEHKDVFQYIYLISHLSTSQYPTSVATLPPKCSLSVGCLQ